MSAEVKTIASIAALAAGACAIGAAATAATVFDATSGATPYVGYIATDDPSLPGVQYTHPFHPAAQLIDGNTATRADTYSGTEVSAAGSNTAPLDFVGVLWAAPVSDIVAIRFHQFVYFDGGWFGTAAGDPYANNNNFNYSENTANRFDAQDVGAPTVQVTSDGGASWSGIASTHDYTAIVQPVVASGASTLIATPILFEFAAQSGIDGIRLVGYGGGRSDVAPGRDEQGWVSAAEFEVGRVAAAVPLPGALPALAGALAMVSALSWRRKRGGGGANQD